MNTAINSLILRIKISSYSLLFKLQSLTVKLARATPGSWKTLGVPTTEVENVEQWINSKVKQDKRFGPALKAPKYFSFEPVGDVTRRFKAAPGLDGVHPELKKQVIEFRQPFLASLPGARILGPYGSVITPAGEILSQSTVSDGLFNRDRIFRLLRFPPLKALEGSYYTIASPFADNYYHWVIEILPRLFAYDSVAEDHPRLIVNSNLRQWQLDSLKLLGFDESELLFLENEYLELANLYLPSYVGINPLTLDWLREALTTSLPKGAINKRVYITRRSAQRRRLLNESEIEPMLLECGFIIAEMESLTFAEQVQLFAQAEMVVSIHGAGLTNMVYAPRGCKVMEIVDPMHVGAMYYMLSETLGHEYYFCIGKTENDQSGKHGGAHGHDDIRVVADSFRQTLSQMVKDEAAVMN